MHAPNALKFERLAGMRIVATRAALDAAGAPTASIALRFAPDELYVTPAADAAWVAAVRSADPHAIIIEDHAFSGVWLDEPDALRRLAAAAEWAMPTERPAFAQGALAGVAAKLYFDAGRVLVVVQTPYAHELEDRLA